jgi:hypothetical protein
VVKLRQCQKERWDKTYFMDWRRSATNCDRPQPPDETRSEAECDSKSVFSQRGSLLGICGRGVIGPYCRSGLCLCRILIVRILVVRGSPRVGKFPTGSARDLCRCCPPTFNNKRLIPVREKPVEKINYTLKQSRK